MGVRGNARATVTLPPLEALLYDSSMARNDRELNRLASHHGVPMVDLNAIDIPADLATRVPAHVARRLQLVPLSADRTMVLVAVADPAPVGRAWREPMPPYPLPDVQIRAGAMARFDCHDAELQVALGGAKLQVAVAIESAVDEALERLYGPVAGDGNEGSTS